MRMFIESYREQMAVLSNQLTLTKEEYHLSKSDLIDNMRHLQLSLKEVEKISQENKQELTQQKPVLNAIEDDLLQILKAHKE
jgi:hypothetical protein